MSEAVTESYARATAASDLTMHPLRQGAVDVLAAAGVCGHKLGSALLRLRTEWDTAAVPDFRAFTDKSEFTTAMILLFASLKTWREARERLHDACALLGFSSIAADQVLVYWLDPNCDPCSGRGYEVQEGTKRLSDRLCCYCRGTGRIRVPGRDGERILGLIIDYTDAASAGMRRALG